MSPCWGSTLRHRSLAVCIFAALAFGGGWHRTALADVTFLLDAEDRDGSVRVRVSPEQKEIPIILVRTSAPIPGITPETSPEPSLNASPEPEPNPGPESIPTPGSNPIPFSTPASAPAAGVDIEMHISPLRSASGDMLTATVDPPRLTAADIAARSLIPLVLRIPVLAPGTRYESRLYLSQNGTVTRVWPLSIERIEVERTNPLVIDRERITISVTMSPLLGSRAEQGSFKIYLRNRAKEEARGIFLRPESAQGEDALRLDVQHHLAFTFDGAPVEDFGSSTAAGNRAIPAGGQVSIGGILANLSAGRYMTMLRFQIPGVTSDESRPSVAADGVMIDVFVRHSVWAPLAVLLGALLLSFFSTKFLIARRQSLLLQHEINEMRPLWLRDEPQSLSVVWVRLLLRQAEERSLRATAVALSAEAIHASINQAKMMLAVLDRVRGLRARFHSMGADPLIKYRPLTALDQVVDKLGIGPLDSDKLQAFMAELAEIEGWLDEGKFRGRYWAELKPRIQWLLLSVQPEGVPKPARETVAKLKQALSGCVDDPPKTIDEMAVIDREYAALKLLWRRREEPELLGELLALVESQAPLEDLLERADHADWDRLALAHRQGLLRFLSPSVTGPRTHEIYQPLVFAVGTGDPEIDDSFMFRSRLQVTWEFTHIPMPPRWRAISRLIAALRGREPVTVKLTSTGSRVVQYANEPGTIKARAVLRFRGQTLAIPEEGSSQHDVLSWPIGSSTSLRIWKSLGAVELYSLVVTSIIAMATGLTMFYVENAAFGSWKDYITLFLWGVGADQTKTFVKQLGARQAEMERE